MSNHLWSNSSIFMSNKLAQQVNLKEKDKKIIPGGLLLSNNPISVLLYEWLSEQGITVTLYSDKLTVSMLRQLSWNRGSYPNVWSFITDTPKGITIHCIDEGLDSGDILIQKQVWFDEHRETFESTYDALNDLILLTLEENWDRIINHQIARIPQQEGIGSSHTVKEFEEFLNGRDIDWKENISMFKQRMKINKKFS